VLLASACLLAGSAVWAQQSQKPAGRVSTDLAFTFAAERAQVLPNTCCFWLKGVGADASFNFWKGMGVAGALNSGTAANVEPGVDVKKISYLAGPRYTYTAWRGKARPNGERRLQVFAQGLFGGVHGYAGLYPSATGSTSKANSFALQTGGGLNYYLTKGFGFRPIEVDFVRSELPNSTTDVQSDLRLSFGLTFHFQEFERAPRR